MNRDSLRAFLLLAPALLTLGVLFLGSLVPALLQSFGYFPAAGLGEPTLRFYREIIASPEFVPSLLFSLRVSFVSSALAVFLGTILALLLDETGKGERIEALLSSIPIIVPHTVAALLVLNLLSRTGILARVLFSLGWIASPAEMTALVFDRRGTGIIAAYLWKGIPFVAVVVYVVLRNIDGRLRETALILGASRMQALRHVALPLLMPTLSSTFVLLFGFSFGAFEAPFLLGPTFPRALPTAAYSAYLNPDIASRPYSMALIAIITAIAVALVYLYSFLSARKEERI